MAKAKITASIIVELNPANYPDLVDPTVEQMIRFEQEVADDDPASAMELFDDSYGDDFTIKWEAV